MYLNTVYFGRGAYGIQAAAQAYFGVDAEDLTLNQSASLAAIIKAPSINAPHISPSNQSLATAIHPFCHGRKWFYLAGGKTGST